MNEEYLQLIWASKRINPFNLRSTDKSQIEIINFGYHNRQFSGPDFSMGQVLIDGILFIGPIEIHVNSSDWLKHKHQFDPKYNNVILHVVYNHDKEIIQNNRQLIVLELKSLIDQKHFNSFMNKRIKQVKILCQNDLINLDNVYLEKMKESALILKLVSKIERVKSNNKLNNKEILYRLLALSFGTKSNSIGFETLYESVPYESIAKVRKGRLKSLLIAESGLLTEKNKTTIWNKKGVRFHGHPYKRISQFADLVELLDFDYLVKQKDPKLLLENFDKFFTRIQLKNSGFEFRLSPFMINQIKINALVPYLYYLGEESGDSIYLNRLIDCLESIKPEQNSILKHWDEIKVESKNAYDSQALLAMDKYYCSRKKCLSCAIGNNLLGR